ncbi:isocitrate lyase [Puccinia sorghi]|uniref:Isocitrate lyase n=1 Tax=Puccinia sorghi TaxID=27349 RepID=A0A0L6UZ25_9BASI|nr:isocitrate lyase [Puccinia sorghi]
MDPQACTGCGRIQLLLSDLQLFLGGLANTLTYGYGLLPTLHGKTTWRLQAWIDKQRLAPMQHASTACSFTSTNQFRKPSVQPPPPEKASKGHKQTPTTGPAAAMSRPSSLDQSLVCQSPATHKPWPTHKQHPLPPKPCKVTKETLASTGHDNRKNKVDQEFPCVPQFSKPAADHSTLAVPGNIENHNHHSSSGPDQYEHVIDPCLTAQEPKPQPIYPPLLGKKGSDPKLKGSRFSPGCHSFEIQQFFTVGDGTRNTQFNEKRGKEEKRKREKRIWKTPLLVTSVSWSPQSVHSSALTSFHCFFQIIMLCWSTLLHLLLWNSQSARTREGCYCFNGCLQAAVNRALKVFNDFEIRKGAEIATGESPGGGSKDFKGSFSLKLPLGRENPGNWTHTDFQGVEGCAETNLEGIGDTDRLIKLLTWIFPGAWINQCHYDNAVEGVGFCLDFFSKLTTFPPNFILLHHPLPLIEVIDCCFVLPLVFPSKPLSDTSGLHMTVMMTGERIRRGRKPARIFFLAQLAQSFKEEGMLGYVRQFQAVEKGMECKNQQLSDSEYIDRIWSICIFPLPLPLWSIYRQGGRWQVSAIAAAESMESIFQTFVRLSGLSFAFVSGGKVQQKKVHWRRIGRIRPGWEFVKIPVGNNKGEREAGELIFLLKVVKKKNAQTQWWISYMRSRGQGKVQGQGQGHCNVTMEKTSIKTLSWKENDIKNLMEGRKRINVIILKEFAHGNQWGFGDAGTQWEQKAGTQRAVSLVSYHHLTKGSPYPIIDLHIIKGAETIKHFNNSRQNIQNLFPGCKRQRAVKGSGFGVIFFPHRPLSFVDGCTHLLTLGVCLVSICIAVAAGSLALTLPRSLSPRGNLPPLIFFFMVILSLHISLVHISLNLISHCFLAFVSG